MIVAFVANFHKTYFFERIALRLTGYGICVRWLCFDKKTYEHLLEHWLEDDILLLSRSIADTPVGPLSDFKLNELVYGDRFLRHQGSWSYIYLKSIQRPVYDFVMQQNIRFIFGETTHAHEILIHRLVGRYSELNCHYLHPQSVRIPSKRFFFLSDEFQSEIFSDSVIVNDKWKTEFMKIEAVRPRRVAQVDKLVKKELSVQGRLKRLRFFFTNENIPNDLPSVVKSKAKRTNIALSQEWNKFVYRFVSTKPLDYLEGKKYVLYTLHMQPEASVDVVGVYYEDQLQNIRNIWRVIPDNWYIVIKEHSNAIGNRSINFFREFKKMQNAILINEHVDSHLLIEGAEAVFTVSGTIAYEAAIKGKPAFTFGDIFFNSLAGCNKISIEDFRKTNNIKCLLLTAERKDIEKMDLETFSKYIYQRSFHGIIDPPVDSEDWEDEDNITEISQAFEKFLNHFE